MIRIHQQWILLILVFCAVLSFGIADCQPTETSKKGYNFMEMEGNYNTKTEVDSTLHYLNKRLSENAADQEALFLRARILSNMNNLEKAHLDYNALIALNPTNKEAVYFRGMVRYQLAQYENAIVDFQEVLQLSFGETETAFYKMDGNTVTGISTINNMEAAIWNNIGLCFYHLQQYEDAINAYDQGVELDQKNIDLKINRALTYEKTEKYQLAINDYKSALVIDPNHPIATYNLMQLQKGPKIHELEELNLFVNNNPDFAPGYNSRGLYYYNINKFSLAEKDFEAAADLNSENINYLFNLGLCQEKLNYFAKAEKTFIQIIAMDEGHSGAYFNLGNIQYKQKAYSEAIAYFTLAHRYNSKNIDILYNRALAYQKNGDLKPACDDMKIIQKSDYPYANAFIKKFCRVEPN